MRRLWSLRARISQVTRGTAPRTPLGTLLACLLASGCSLAGPPPGAGAPEPAPAAEAEGGDAREGAVPSPGTSEVERTEEERALPARPRPAGYRTEPRFPEVRALWVVRTSLADPDTIRTMVARADEAGFNTLLVQVRGRGDAYYRSHREPPPSALRGIDAAFDPLATVVSEARRRGLAVHAWVNVHLVAGIGPLPDDRAHLVRARPQWLAVPRELGRELYGVDPASPRYAEALLRYARKKRDRIEGIYTSPAHPAVADHVVGVLEDLAAGYDLDGIHLDYIRYPAPDFDYARPALEAFRARVDPHLPPEQRRALAKAYRSDPFAYADALPERWEAFRRDRVTELVRRAYFRVKERNPDLLVTAAVRPDPEEARRDRFQDWASWLQAWVLDAAVLMAYTEKEELFRRWIETATERLGGERIWAGVGLYKTTARGSVEQIRVARARGVRGISLFSYDWAVGEGSRLEPGEPLLGRIGREAFGVGSR